jgi:uncharacterized protein (TIGR00369 family)
VSQEIPKDFEPFAEDDGYIGHNGPYYARDLGADGFVYGFQTDERHSNPNNVIHGAALVGFVDTVLGHMVVGETGRFCATVSLSTQFISGTQAGGWVEATGRIKKVTRTMVFADVDVYHEGKILMSATSVFKLFGDRQE